MYLLTLAGSPKYTVNLDQSEFDNHRIRNHEHVFEVEQGNRFYLKLKGNRTHSEPELYHDGYEVPDAPNGTIIVGKNSMEIRSVEPNDEGRYTMEAPNGAAITFRLKVIGTEYAHRMYTLS